MKKTVYLITGVFLGLLLGAVAFSKPADKTLDPAKLAPQMYKTILDNHQLRAMDYHLKPGEQEPTHRHPHGILVYFFTDADMVATGSDGKTSESHNRAGDIVWRDPVTHFTKNIGKNEVHTLLVEPKCSCSD